MRIHIYFCAKLKSKWANQFMEISITRANRSKNTNENWNVVCVLFAIVACVFVGVCVHCRRLVSPRTHQENSEWHDDITMGVQANKDVGRSDVCSTKWISLDTHSTQNDQTWKICLSTAGWSWGWYDDERHCFPRVLLSTWWSHRAVPWERVYSQVDEDMVTLTFASMCGILLVTNC